MLISIYLIRNSMAIRLKLFGGLITPKILLRIYIQSITFKLNYQTVMRFKVVSVIVACPRDCYDTCFYQFNERGILEHTGKPTVPLLCPRALKDIERMNSPNRVLYPYLRIDSKAHDSWRRVSIKEAIKVVSEKLNYILKNFGPKHILFFDYAGNRGVFTRYITQRLWYFLNVARIDYSICDGAGINALMLHYGSTYGKLPKHMRAAKLFVYWGFNAAVSSPHNFFFAKKIAKETSAYIITIDVRKSETARLSDFWIRPKFGTDTYLALGIANYIIKNKLYDEEFIEKYTYGFEAFREYVSDYDLSKVSRITGVKKTLIEKLANIYVEKKPNIIFIGYGLQRRYGGGEAVRAISLLPALIGIHRGFYYGNIDGLKIDIPYLTGSQLGRPSRIIPQSKVAQLIANGEFKFIYIHLTNPAATHPKAKILREGLLRDDVFVVVHETHWSETAKLADVVLPAPTWLEKEDFVFSYWHNYGVLNKRLFKPKGESIEEWKLMMMLAKALGINEELIYEDPLSALKKALPKEIWDAVIRGEIVEIPYRKLNEYQTPTRKIEFTSTKAHDYGVSPLPTPAKIESPKEYPYILISSSNPKYTHSQFEDEWGPIPPIVYISPQNAEELGIKNGDKVRLSNENGSIIMVARIDPGIPPYVVFAYKSATTVDGKRINFITSDNTNELGGATINSTYVKIERLDADSEASS